MSAQHAADLAHLAFVRQVLFQDLPHAHARRELHQGVAAVEQDGQQAAEAADQGPVFGEQHREPARLPGRRAADEDRHRHQLHVLVRIQPVRHQQARQGVGMVAVLGPADQAGAAARQRHVGALAAQRIARQRRQRRRQAGLAAGAVEDQRVRQAVVLDHVTDRPVEIEGRHRRLALDLDPGLQQLLDEARPQRRAGQLGRRARRRRRSDGIHGGVQPWRAAGSAVSAVVGLSSSAAASGALPVSDSASSASSWRTASALYQASSRRSICISKLTVLSSRG